MEIEYEDNLDEFVDALWEYHAATDKTFPEILNRRAEQITRKAIRYTPMASLAKIRRFDPKKRPEKAPNRLLFALSASEGRNRQSNADSRLNRRLQSRGYQKAGWIAVLQKMGKKARKPASRELQAEAEWDPATLRRKVAKIGNPAFGTESGKPPKALARAIKEDARDMVDYAEKKLGLVADEYSAIGARG